MKALTVLFSALVSVLLVACGSTSTKYDDVAVADAMRTSQEVMDSSVTKRSIPGSGSFTFSGREIAPMVSSPSSTSVSMPDGSMRSVYFGYDQYDIPAQYQGALEANANMLRQNQSVKILVQGNTDARGSREYNLALGQKRAESVKRALSVLGAGHHQVEAVSLGEEQPRAEGSNESAWAENRRADILYSGEY